MIFIPIISGQVEVLPTWGNWRHGFNLEVRVMFLPCYAFYMKVALQCLMKINEINYVVQELNFPNETIK